MAQNVALPHWGMEVSEGTVVKWLKREGEAVKKGEPLAEIETEKAVSDLESPSDGVLARILVAEGATVEVGAVLAVVAEPGESVVAPPRHVGAPVPRLVGGARPGDAGAAGAQVEPVARRLAQEKGIPLASVAGSGPGGRITLEDVRRAAAAGAAAAPPASGAPLTGMRALIARRMQRSAQETAAVTLTAEADVTALEEMRQEMRRQGIDRLAIIVKAVALSLKEHPELNARLQGDRLQLVPEVNIGVAVALDQGLVVPVIHNADAKGLDEITRELRRLAGTIREGKQRHEELRGGTFTVTSLAAEGVDAFTPIINQPEAAILGVGRIIEKPGVHEGAIAKRAFMWLSLTFDHRACDGAPAARLLRAIRRRLEDTAWAAPR